MTESSVTQSSAGHGALKSTLDYAYVQVRGDMTQGDPVFPVEGPADTPAPLSSPSPAARPAGRSL